VGPISVDKPSPHGSTLRGDVSTTRGALCYKAFSRRTRDNAESVQARHLDADPRAC
jgi:hypothetical protein